MQGQPDRTVQERLLEVHERLLREFEKHPLTLQVLHHMQRRAVELGHEYGVQVAGLRVIDTNKRLIQLRVEKKGST